MATTFGLTTTGFLIPTLAEIRDDINQELTDTFGASIDLTNGILARIIGILVERYGLLWEVQEAVYNAQNPDAASGFALKALCLLTGTLAIEAVFSTITLTLTGTPTTTVPAGQQVATASNGGVNKFLTAEAGTIVVLPAWAGSTLYAVGTRVTNASKCYQCLTSGTSASSGGPTTGTTGATSTEADGTALWLYLGDGTGAVDVPGQSAAKGPIVGVARDILQIDQPYGGWAGVINVLDATLGYDDQSDESLRLSREEELSQPGASTADAIAAALLFLTGVTSVTVFHNDTDVTDADGLTPHTVEALVRGGDTAEIGVTLLGQITAGIQTAGTTTTTPLDAEGIAQTIKFSRPAEINIGVAVTVVKDPTVYPADGDAQIKLAIATGGNAPNGIARKCGVNARSSAVSSSCFAVPGVLEVTVCNLSSVAAPGTPPVPSGSASIAISRRQLAVFDTSWISVTTSDDVP